MLGYLTVVVLVMAVSVYAILKIRQLNRGTEYILNIDNRILEDQKKLTDAILSQLRYERKFIITRDTTFYNQFLSAKGEFDKYLEDVLSVVDTPRLRRDLSMWLRKSPAKTIPMEPNHRPFLSRL